MTGTASVAVDVAIVGGGPGGSVAAAALARAGRSVVVLEKAHFPRFHLGESLLPRSLPVLEAIGVLPEVEATFIRKYGARFHDDVGSEVRRVDRFAFVDAWRGELPHAYQVPRDAFDALLLRHAGRCGADVRHGTTASRIVREGGRAVGVACVDEAGTASTIEARFVLDASGRDALTAHEGRTTVRIPGLDQTALYAHFEGVERAEGELAGDIDIVLFRTPGEARPSWFWVIPFKDGRTSVGAVVSKAWIAARREAGGSPQALFDEAVRASPTATRLLANAKMLWPAAQATADFSYRVGARSGAGWMALGDAAGFIDPLFSTGAHLAMEGGHRAAQAVLRLLDDPSSEEAVRAAYDKEMTTAAETFIVAVQAFYAGPLVDYLFAETKHNALRRSITSLLSGDVFVDAVWLRDARLRLGAMAQPPV